MFADRKPTSVMRILLLFPFLVTTLFAQEPGPSPAEFADGDTVVWLGDSITYQAHWAEYLRGFYHTRYPERRLRFVNAGNPGHKAGNALDRFEFDVARHKPAAVTVMFAMNDGRYQEVGEGDNLATYQADMTELVKRIKAIGARPILLSPTPFDAQTSAARQDDETYRFRGKGHSPNYNYLLAYYGAWGRSMASREGIAFVNQYGPMNDYMFQRRLTEPAFTLMPDAIHPDPAGHVLMAVSFLEDLRPERRRAAGIVLLKRGTKWVAAGKDHGVTDIEATAERLAFTATAKSLPWVVPEKHTTKELRWKNPANAREMYKAGKAGHKWSADMLKVVGLAPGTWQVKIDGTVVKQTTHVVLGTKIEMQENEDTPQYQQALKVAHLNRALTDELVRPLRDLINRRNRKPDDEKLAQQIESMEAQIREREAAIYAAAQPVPRRWELVKIK